MNQTLAQLIKISHATGTDARLVQGGGGNTSMKTPDGKAMYIKASGTALKDMDETRGWRMLDTERVMGILDDVTIPKLATATREAEVVNQFMLSCIDTLPNGGRPSVETILHAMLDAAVIHLHPIAVQSYVNAKNGQAALEKLFAKEKYPPLWVPYVDPGYTLAVKTAQLVKTYEEQYGRKPAIVFMDKHGLLVSSSDADSALRLVKKVIRTCEEPIKAVSAKVKALNVDDVVDATLAIRQACHEVTGRYMVVKHHIDEAIAGFMKQKDAKSLLRGALSPDELVYANGPALWLDSAKPATIIKALQRVVAKGMKAPAAFIVKDLGLFVTGDAKTAGIIQEIATGSIAIRAAAAKIGGVKTLTKKEADFIINWEVENFRQQVAGGAGVGELKDRIAIVTGAGSGLGRSIAVGLARAGANVAIADIDPKAAQETCDLIKAELPKAGTMPVACNVTDEAGVDEGFSHLINEWGGIDILVNAAGVAPAYPLVDFPVDKWRFALEVNLTGYFLMARAAARLMIRQQMGGAMVIISSKSGLDASKNNMAYNATKAGELHMARGWAMELGDKGIRVNCVCPGNVFEGSKIWNPDYIKVCAKKYGIKPEEVIPYYVDKTILKQEIKGQDIADSVVFLSSDRSQRITGQTIVADAGQVFVR